MTPFALAIISVLIVSAVSFIGALGLALKGQLLRKVIMYLVSFAAGALLGDAFIHLLPELSEETGFTVLISLTVLLGILVSFIIEKFIHWHHCHNPQHHHSVKALAYLNLFGDGVHNFIDGLIIGGAYLVDTQVGIATTLAVVLHEIPQELGDFAILIHAGLSKAKALLYNFLSAIAALLGAVIAYAAGTAFEMQSFLVAFAAGSFVYIALADLVPELHKETKTSTSILQLGCFVIGIAFMALLLLLE